MIIIVYIMLILYLNRNVFIVYLIYAYILVVNAHR